MAATTSLVLTSLDALIENCIGQGLTSSQIFHVFLVSLAWLFDGQQVIHKCLLRRPTKMALHLSPSPCSFPPNSWSWNSPPSTSTISDFNLFCSSHSFLSSFFFGSLVGIPALSFLADLSLGRKRTLLLSSSIMSLASLSTAASTNLWSYSLLRFISGFGRANLGSCVLLPSCANLGSCGKKMAWSDRDHRVLIFHCRVHLPPRRCLHKQEFFLEDALLLDLTTCRSLLPHSGLLRSGITTVADSKRKRRRDTLRWLGGDGVRRSFIFKAVEHVGEVDTLSALGMLVKKRW